MLCAVVSEKYKNAHALTVSLELLDLTLLGFGPVAYSQCVADVQLHMEKKGSDTWQAFTIT